MLRIILGDLISGNIGGNVVNFDIGLVDIPSPTWVVNNCRYVKVGKQITLNCQLQYSGVSNSNPIKFNNIPFNPIMQLRQVTTDFNGVKSLQLNTNGILEVRNPADGSPYTYTNLNNRQLFFSFVYITT